MALLEVGVLRDCTIKKVAPSTSKRKIKENFPK
jgi:hypothetical protein